MRSRGGQEVGRPDRAVCCTRSFVGGGVVDVCGRMGEFQTRLERMSCQEVCGMTALETGATMCDFGHWLKFSSRSV